MDNHLTIQLYFSRKSGTSEIEVFRSLCLIIEIKTSLTPILRGCWKSRNPLNAEVLWEFAENRRVQFINHYSAALCASSAVLCVKTYFFNSPNKTFAPCLAPPQRLRESEGGKWKGEKSRSNPFSEFVRNILLITN